LQNTLRLSDYVCELAINNLNGRPHADSADSGCGRQWWSNASPFKGEHRQAPVDAVLRSMVAYPKNTSYTGYMSDTKPGARVATVPSAKVATRPGARVAPKSVARVGTKPGAALDTAPEPPQRKAQALQAVLSRKNIEITCALVFEDESVSFPAIQSVSVRGAQREATGMLVAHGYTPVGRWSEGDEDNDGYTEWNRSFKPGPDADFMIADLPIPRSRNADPHHRQPREPSGLTLPPSS
jgi:hypothetical protein